MAFLFNRLKRMKKKPGEWGFTGLPGRAPHYQGIQRILPYEFSNSGITS